MIQRKDSVVKQTCDGVNFLMKKNKIDVYTGVGEFIGKNQIKITADKTETVIESAKLLLLQVQKPSSLPRR